MQWTLERIRDAAPRAPTAKPSVRGLPHHYEDSAFVNAPSGVLFEYVDDHEQLSSHMSESSWMMDHGQMKIEVDGGHGQPIGSEIRLSGRVLGTDLFVAERVIVREPPLRKAWETGVAPRLLVIGHYRMGFEIAPRQSGSLLRTFIDYALPETSGARLLDRVVSDPLGASPSRRGACCAGGLAEGDQPTARSHCVSGVFTISIRNSRSHRREFATRQLRSAPSRARSQSALSIAAGTMSLACTMTLVNCVTRSLRSSVASTSQSRLTHWRCEARATARKPSTKQLAIAAASSDSGDH